MGKIPHRLNELRAMASCHTDDCIIWPHAVCSGGYPALRVDNAFHRGHVLVCTQYHGPRPATGLLVAHDCGNRRCVNPRHLRWATPAENTADMDIHGTMVWGEQHRCAKLTERSVKEMRRRHAQGEPISELARYYGVHRITARSAIRGTTWSRVA